MRRSVGPDLGLNCLQRLSADDYRPLVKSVYQNINFLTSQPKHMLWVLKKTV